VSRNKKYFFFGGEQAVKTRSSAKSERARKAAKEERRKTTKRKQEQNTAMQKEEGRLRREAGVVAEVRKRRPNKLRMKGTEMVDSTILKVLGKSPKSKVTALAKGRGKREAPKVVAQEERSSRISRKIIHEKMQERKKRSKLPEKKSVEKKQPVCQVLPCVDLGPDYDAEGGNFCNDDGAVALEWPLGPDCTEPGSGDEASALPIQAPLELMPPCMELSQVRQK
jgi:hypothetical protein